MTLRTGISQQTYSHLRPKRSKAVREHQILGHNRITGFEFRLEPTQHSVKELRAIGIAPDVLVCRAEHEIPEEQRAKIALFCNVRREAVIPAYDLKSIYEAPLAFHAVGLDQAVLDAFSIAPAPRPDLRVWRDVFDRVENPEGEVRVAVVGNYPQLEDAYKSIREALTHGGIANRVKVTLRPR